MKHFLQKILTCMFVCVMCVFGAIDSANAATFNVSTSSTNVFTFQLSAQGTFTVNCGTGGTLGSDDSTAAAMISGATINKSDTAKYTFKCSYSNSSSRTIGFDGLATGYSSTTSVAAISFSGNAKITSISGNLRVLFPYISGNAQGGAQPRFYGTFNGCTGLTSITSVFSGYTTGATYMFNQTFMGCTGLTSIPSGLFGSSFTTGAKNMFSQTFKGCTNLTSIPSNLFGNIATSADYMFNGTFSGCTRLASIPSNLFSSFTAGADYMFYNTFENCTGLSSIPSGLFSNFTSGKTYMFGRTFYTCTNLTSIPSGLFSNITAGAQNTFYQTFYGCTRLTGYISPTLFAGLIANNAATNVFNSTFGSSGMYQSCQSGTSSYATTYTSSWGGKVSCTKGLFVSYSCGVNGSGNPSDSSVYTTFATVTTKSSSVCTPSSGYAFDKWSCRYGASSQYIVNADATFTMPPTYVVCTAQYVRSYTVSFSYGTYGSGSMSSQTNKPVGTTITLPASTFTATNGYYFTGWNCNNGIGDRAVGQTFTMPAASVTCTAQWAAINYAVSFAPGGYASGSMSSQTNKHVGDTITLPSSTFTGVAYGYHFDKWNCNNNIGDKTAGATFTMPAANVACTAQWASNTVSLMWYGDDGTTTVSGGASSCTYNGTISSLPTAPEKPGYHFTRWKIKPAACFIPSTLVDTGGSTIGCRNVDGTYEYYSNSSVYQLTENSTWVVEWSNGEKVYGRGICSGQSGTNNDRTYSNPSTTTDESELTSASGEKKYCWCAATGYISNGGTQCSLTNTLWEFDYSTSVSSCANYCELNCANDVIRFSGFRSVLFGAGN